MGKLVPERECGDCTVCCIVPKIDMPEIQKRSGATCRHCTTGCNIYETRPQVCRNYYCAWRRLDIFGEEWRPDKSGVFAELGTRGIPAYFTESVGINLTLVDNPLKTVRQPWFVNFVATGVTKNTPLFLVLPGPQGHLAAKVLLNSKEMREAAAKTRSHVKDLLEKALKKLSAHNFKEHSMTNSGSDVSS